MKPLAYLITRLAIGASIWGHGLVRLPKLTAFAEGTAQGFENSMLPMILVLPFSYFIPLAEFVIGVLVLAGLFTRLAAFAGGLLMVALLIGTTLTESWGAIPSQLLHTAFFVVLLQFEEANEWSVDRLVRR